MRHSNKTDGRLKDATDSIEYEEDELVVSMVGGGNGEEIPMPKSSSRFSSPSINWFKTGKWSMYLIALVTPFLFLPITVAPVETNKTMVVFGLLCLGLISFLVTTIERRKIVFNRSLASLAVLGVLIFSFISSIFSKSPITSFYGNLAQPDSFLNIIVYSLMFFLASYFIEKEDALIVGKFFLTGGCIAVVLGLLQFFGIFLFPWAFAQQTGFNPLGSIYGFGLFAAFLAVASVATAEFVDLKGSVRQLFLGLAIIMFVALALLASQAIWLVLSIVVLIIAGVQFTRNKKIGFLLGIVVVGLFFTFISQYLPQFVKLPNEIRPSFSATFETAKAIVLSKRAAIGFGPANFGSAFSLFRPIEGDQLGFLGVRFGQGYSFIFTALITSGILGFLSWICFIGFVLYASFKRLEDQYAAAISFGMVFLAVSLFFFPTFFVQLVILFFGLGLLTALSGKKSQITFENLSRAQLFSLFVVLIGSIVGVLSGVYFVGQKYAAAAYYDSAVTKLQAGNIDEGLQLLDKVVTLDRNNDAYWRLGSRALLLQGQQLLNQKGNANVQASLGSVIARARDAAVTATQLSPNDSSNWDNLGFVYENIIPLAQGADGLAVESYQKAIDLDPKNPQEPVNAARALLTGALATPSNQSDVAKDKISQAQKFLEMSTSINPTYAPANFSLVQLYIKQGDISKAVSKVQEIQSLSPLDAGLAYQLGLIAYQNNQLDIAQAQFERAVSIYPDYSNAIYFLGLIYDNRGLKAQAKAAFERLLELNPDNEQIKQTVKGYSGGQLQPAETTVGNGTSTATSTKPTEKKK